MRATWVHGGLALILAAGCGSATGLGEEGTGDVGPDVERGFQTTPDSGTASDSETAPDTGTTKDIDTPPDSGPAEDVEAEDAEAEVFEVRCDDPAADFSCEDEDPCTEDTCDDVTGDCVFTPITCDDSLYCNGLEVCDPTLGCQAGAAPETDDGIDCTVDACDEALGVVTHTPEDAGCDDGTFCNGTEACDATLGCQAGVLSIDDEVDCTIDACDETAGVVTHVVDSAACDDGLYCNGTESCDATLGCQQSSPPDGDDGVDCTLDACDEEANSFTHLIVDSACDDALVCNGAETCDAALGCQPGTPPVTNDGVDCTLDGCDDALGGVQNTPDDTQCDDGIFCDGAEVCDSTLGCQESAAPEADDGVECTIDACDEDTETVTHTADGTLCITHALCVEEGCDPQTGCYSNLIADCCGNGLVEDGESCDDANEDDADGCTNACKMPEAVQIAGGFQHTCVRFHGGTVKCWGWNAWGQLGPAGSGAVGDEPGEMGPGLLAVDLGTAEDGSPLAAVDLDAGGASACALLADGRVKCWGNNVYGQLGLGNKTSVGSSATTMGEALPAVDLGTGEDAAALRAIDVETASKHNCAILEGGGVKCWGHNDMGQLGLGDMETRGDDEGEMGDTLPFVDLGTDDAGEPLQVVAQGASEWHGCAIVIGGGLKCWGRNNYGELGLGDDDYRGDEPGEMGDDLPHVDLGTDDAGQPLVAIAVVARKSLTCAVLDGGGVKCWGYGGPNLGLGGGGGDRGDDPGEMGDNLPFIDLGTDLETTGPLSAVALTRGPCAHLADGTAKCWGYNDHGQLGLGDMENRGDQPGEMGDALGPIDLGMATGGEPLQILSLSSGNKHTCAILGDGQVKCWGENAENWGQLGLGDTEDRGDDPGEMGDDLPFVQLGQ